MIIGALASALDSRRGIGGGVSGNKCQRESLVGKTSHDVVDPLCVLPMCVAKVKRRLSYWRTQVKIKSAIPM